MKKFIRKLFKLAILVIALLVVAGAVYRWLGHRALQNQIADLHSKGEKLTFSELAGTVSTNAAECVSAVTNAGHEAAPVPAKGKIEAINLLPFVDAGRARVVWRVENPTWVVTDMRGASVTWAELSNFVAELSGPLSGLRAPMKDPAAACGVGLDVYLSSVEGSARRAAQRLGIAALLELHYGNRAEALAHIQSLAGLAALNREGYSLGLQMIRLAIIDLGLDVTWQALQAPDWSAEQLRDLQRCWEGIDPLKALEAGAVAQRAGILEIPTIRSEHDVRYPAGAPLVEIVRWGSRRAKKLLVVDTFVDNDLAFGLRCTQSQIDLARAMQTNRVWREVRDEYAKLDAKLEKRNRAPLRQLFQFSVAVLSPDMQRTAQTAMRTEIERRLTVTATALKRYQLKHGQLPPTLEKLVPDFLASVPMDCISGRPLHYQANADGTFSLYSIGEDARDNGGDPSPSKATVKPGLWEGRDAVWPLAAKE